MRILLPGQMKVMSSPLLFSVINSNLVLVHLIFEVSKMRFNSLLGLDDWSLAKLSSSSNNSLNPKRVLVLNEDIKELYHSSIVEQLILWNSRHNVSHLKRVSREVMFKELVFS